MKTITVLKRAEIKKASAAYGVNPGDIVCIVKGSTGNVYTTTLRRNKQHTCTCPGNAKGKCECYHIKNLKALENARYAAEKAYSMSNALHEKLASVVTPKVEEASEQVSTTEESDTFESVSAQVAPETVNFKSPKVRKQGKKLVKLDYRSAQTVTFFSNLPSRQLVGSR